MNEKNEVEYSYAEMPMMGLLYAKALINRKQRTLGDNVPFPKLVGMIENHEPDLASVEEFRQLCGFEDNGFLPCTYPFAMANPIMMDLFTSKEFPLKAMGLVHVKQEINQIQPIPDDSVLNIKCATGEARKVKRGYEFDMTIEVYIKDKLVWNATCSILSRADLKSEAQPKKPTPERAPMNTDGKQVEEWSLSSDLGRRYAKASGDYNPIHLHAWSAKLLGFKSHIIHGMWTMSRVAAVLTRGRESFNFSIVFKAPIFLPNNISLIYETSGLDTNYRVTSVTKTRDFAIGRIEPAQAVSAAFEKPVIQEEYTPAPTTILEQELIGR